MVIRIIIQILSQIKKLYFNMQNIISLLRPHQYTKNLFIFAPLFFSFNFDIDLLIKIFFIFLLFCLIASSVYIFNDLKDIEEDRAHPTKCKRPLASGTLSVGLAKLLIILLASVALVGSLFINLYLFLVLATYFLLNITYSLKLKHIAIVDIFIIATGFVLRLFAGSSILDMPLSMWIIIMTFLLAIFLAIAKRRDDVLLSLQGKQTRKNIDGYNLEFVNAAMVLMAGVVIVAYILYTVSDDVMVRFGSHYLYLTASFVILGILRYMQITFVEENSGSPTKLVLKDRFLQATILLWLCSFIVLVKLT